MTRKVLCLQDNETVPITNCDGNSVPFSSDTCNNNPCGEDEVSVVDVSHDLHDDEEEDCEEEEEEEEETDDATTPMDFSSDGSVRTLIKACRIFLLIWFFNAKFCFRLVKDQ